VNFNKGVTRRCHRSAANVSRYRFPVEIRGNPRPRFRDAIFLATIVLAYVRVAIFTSVEQAIRANPLRKGRSLSGCRVLSGMLREERRGGYGDIIMARDDTCSVSERPQGLEADETEDEFSHFPTAMECESSALVGW